MRPDGVALKVVASTVVGAALVAAVTLHRWDPLALLTSLVLLSFVRWWMQRHRRAESSRELFTCRALPDFSELDYARLLASLN